MRTYTRKDLQEIVESHISITQDAAHGVVTDLVNILANAILDHKSISITCLGSLVPHTCNARPGRNPKTMEPAIIAPRISYRLRGSKWNTETSTGRLGATLLAKKLHEANVNVTLVSAREIVKDIFVLINAILDDGYQLAIRGFGRFYVRYDKPRVKRNPATGETFMAEATKVPLFKLSKTLRKELLV